MAGIYIRKQNGMPGKVSAEEAFPFLREKGHVISLVGGGGKTTLMYHLAEHGSRIGQRVLVTTTTHIYRPPQKVCAGTQKELEAIWRCNIPAVVGKPAGEEKLSMPEEGWLHRCMGLADTTYVEADGAKHMPCKVPARHEPVLLAETDIILGVMGMDAWGRRIGEICFRAQETAEFLGVSKEHRLTAEDMAKILSSPCGTRKGVESRSYYVVLSQCDTEERRAIGCSILALLGDRRIRGGVLTTFTEAERREVRERWVN